MDSTFPFLDLPPEVVQLIVQIAPQRARRALFSACHTTRRLVLSCMSLVTIHLERGAGGSEQQRAVTARLLESPAAPAGLRITRSPAAGSVLPSLQLLVQASGCRTLELWNEDISEDIALGTAYACAGLASLAVDLSGGGSNGARTLVYELSSVCSQLTRLELNFGIAAECLEPLAVPSVLPDLQHLGVHYVDADSASIAAPELLRRITDLSVNLQPCGEDEFAACSSPWVVQMTAQPQAFQRLSALYLGGSLPWCGLLALASLPALTKLSAMQLAPPSTNDIGANELPGPLQLRVLQLVSLSCSDVCRLSSFIKQVPLLKVQRLALPETAPGGGEGGRALRELQQAAAVLGAAPCVCGWDVATGSLHTSCIDLDSLTDWLRWRGADTVVPGVAPLLPEGAEPVDLLLPMARHLSAVSLASCGVPEATLPHLARSLGMVLGPHTHTLNIGRCLAPAEDLWAVVIALPRLKVMCFCLRLEMESPLQGLIELCEAAHRRLELQAVGYGRDAEKEAAMLRLSAGCRGFVELELHKL